MHSDEEFISAVKTSRNIREVIEKINLSSKQNHAYKYFHREVKRLGISTNHFDPYHQLRKLSRKRKISYEEILVTNSSYKTTDLKKRLIKDGFFKNKCSSCGIDDQWNGESITLQMDHINGVNNDHRLENLRILCPNCHSQTSTWGMGPHKKKQNKCNCGVSIGRKSKQCHPCSVKREYPSRCKIKWPTIKVLTTQLKTENYEVIARSLGVSSNAIRKHIQKYKVES